MMSAGDPSGLSGHFGSYATWYDGLMPRVARGWTPVTVGSLNEKEVIE